MYDYAWAGWRILRRDRDNFRCCMDDRITTAAFEIVGQFTMVIA